MGVGDGVGDGCWGWVLDMGVVSIETMSWLH